MLDYSKSSINQNKSKLSPDEFKLWFESKFKGNWKKAYKDIGGKIKEKKVEQPTESEPSE